MIMLKRLYHVVAWLALANLFATGGLLAFLFGSGRLNSERVDQIAVVLRGEFPKPQPPASQPVVQQEKPRTSKEELAQLESRRQLYTLISERHQREIDDRNKLNQVIQLDVNRQLEQIKSKEQEFRKTKEQNEQVFEQSGFQQALDMYSEMEPKLAKDVLIKKKDADVVRVFVKMESGKRKKIVNTCKTPEEKDWIGRILSQIGRLDELEPAPGEVPTTAVADSATAGP